MGDNDKAADFVARKMSELEKPENVFVGILAHGYMNHTAITQLMFDMGQVNGTDQRQFGLSRPSRFVFLPWICESVNPQPLARNMILDRGMKAGADTIVMIDHDMIPHGIQMLFGLLETPDYDIAGPLQLMGFRWTKGRGDDENGDPHIYPVAGMYDKTLPEGTRFVPVSVNVDTPVQDVDVVGSGIMAVKRRVLEDERMQVAPGYSPPAWFQNVFQPNGVRTRGLDVDFCVRARDLGYSVKVNWYATSGHFKSMDLFTYRMYTAQQVTLAIQETERANELPMAAKQSG